VLTHLRPAGRINGRARAEALAEARAEARKAAEDSDSDDPPIPFPADKARAALTARRQSRNLQQVRRAGLTQEGYRDHQELESYRPGREGAKSAADRFARGAGGSTGTP